MPDTTPAAPGGGKKLAGQPWWVWAAGLGAIAIGYYLIKKQQSAAATAAAPSSQGTATAAASPTGTSLGQYLLWVIDHQGQPTAATSKCPPTMNYDAKTKRCICKYGTAWDPKRGQCMPVGGPRTPKPAGR